MTLKIGGFKAGNRQSQPKGRRFSPLFHFTVSFFLILLIPISMGVFHFGYMLETATQQNVYTNTLILKNSMDVLESSLRSIYTYSNSLNQIKVLDDLVSTDSRERINLLDLQEAVATFPFMREPHRYVDVYFLYSSRSDMILAPLQAFINLELYYGSYFKFGDMPFQQWKDEILYNEAQRSGLFTLPLPDGERLLMFQTPYVSRRDGRVAGQLIYLLDNNRITNALSPAFDMGAGFLYIEDNRGNLMVSMERDGWEAVSLGDMGTQAEGSLKRVIDGRNVLATYCQSRDYGWTYVVAVPESTLVAQAMESMRMTLVITIFLTLAGIMLILFVYRYNKSPLQNIVEDIAPHGGAGEAQPAARRNQNGLWQISGSITSLVTDRSRMQEQIQQQLQALRQSFLVQLVTGQILDEARLPQFLLSCGIDEAAVSIRGCYLKILSREIAEAARVQEAVGQAVQISDGGVRLIPCFWVDSLHLTVLCLEEADAQPEKCMELLRGMHFLLMEQWGLETRFALGSACAAFGDAHESFREAKNLLITDGEISPILVATQASPTHWENYAYSAREEATLLEMAGGGRFAEVRGLLGKIRRANFSERRLSPQMREMLLYRMSSTLLCAGWGARLPQGELLSALGTEDFFTLLEEQYRLACEQNARRRQESHERMQSDIVRYIDENFRDRDMGLGALSQHFGVTESYLSTLIKTLVGENFSSYLESKRIDEANRLLRNGNTTVGEVGHFVGYDSPTSFSRAYKRVMGHSPSQYLKLHTYAQANHTNGGE